jgi:hypothetical protein
VATTVGTAKARIQIVGPGAGTGLPVLTAAIKEAQEKRWSMWGIIHNLQGQVRNCGCSQGSLGGAGFLAALPGHAAALAPGLTLRWALTGDVDGKRPGLGVALAEKGWEVAPQQIRLAAEVGPLLSEPGVIAVIPTRPNPINHRRILEPALPLGMAVDLLLVDGKGIIQARHVLPVDRTLPEDPSLPAQFPDRLTKTIAMQSNPSKSCAPCHKAEFATWEKTRHAIAFQRLPEADRTDTCVTCHTAPRLDGALVPNVHCQDCHQGADIHAMAPEPKQKRTTGRIDCRSCHDTLHHPSFQRERGWDLIKHGVKTLPAPAAPGTPAAPAAPMSLPPSTP